MFERFKTKNQVEVNYKNSLATDKIAYYLSEYLTDNSAIVCIGTDKCIIDSLGPIIGTILVKQDIGIDVYGTLDNPVHAMNINDYIKILNKKNYDKVIAIDACLSSRMGVGTVKIDDEPIMPGKGIGKSLPEIGDISIVGVTGSGNTDFHDLVQDTRLSLIYNMAEVIASGIVSAVSIKVLYKEVANC